MSSTKISLCLLTFNELEGCKVDVPLLPRQIFDEVFALDGGSADGTVEFLRENDIPVHRQQKPGLNQAYKEAVEVASHDLVVVFFPKGTVSPEILHDMKRYLEEGYDVVIPCRNMPGGRNEEDDDWLRPRKWGVTALSHFIHVVWNRNGPRIRDVLHGIKGVRRDAFEKIDLTDLKVTVDLECAVRCYRLNLKYIEFPVQEKARFYGETHFKIMPCVVQYLKFFRYEILHRWGARRSSRIGTT